MKERMAFWCLHFLMRLWQRLSRKMQGSFDDCITEVHTARQRCSSACEPKPLKPPDKALQLFWDEARPLKSQAESQDLRGSKCFCLALHRRSLSGCLGSSLQQVRFRERLKLVQGHTAGPAAKLEPSTLGLPSSWREERQRGCWE